MSQQPPTHRDAAPASDGQDAPTVSLRPSASGTNTMAILSVVFAFLFSPLGIVFGVVGRRQTRRTGQRGRGLATSGLVLSVVFLVVGVAAALWVTVLAVQIAPSVPPDAADQPAVAAPADPAGPAPTGPAGTATVGVTDGDYGPEVPTDALAEQVGAQSCAVDVICSGYLPAQVDASTTCAATVDGQQAQLETRVTAVEGSEATVDIARVG